MGWRGRWPDSPICEPSAWPATFLCGKYDIACRNARHIALLLFCIDCWVIGTASLALHGNYNVPNIETNIRQAKPPAGESYINKNL